MKLLIILPLILALFFFAPQISYEHQDGCHRWHSCPSDSGSYVCGDLGYDSECPWTATNEPQNETNESQKFTPVESEKIESWKNIRDEIVFVFPSSVEKLVERGYLVEPQ